jgi:hypothetical protein
MAIEDPNEEYSELVAAGGEPVQPVVFRNMVLEAFNSVCRGMGDLKTMQVGLDFHQFVRRGPSGQRFGGSSAPEPPLRPGVQPPTIDPEAGMGRGLLLWLIGIPLPIILVIWLFGGLS